MNEKIKDFLEQAYTYSFQENRGQFVLNDFAEKFAELIVRECAEQIRLQGVDWLDFAPSQQGIRPEYAAMAAHIKQHFGVEE